MLINIDLYRMISRQNESALGKPIIGDSLFVVCQFLIFKTNPLMLRLAFFFSTTKIILTTKADIELNWKKTFDILKNTPFRTNYHVHSSRIKCIYFCLKLPP